MSQSPAIPQNVRDTLFLDAYHRLPEKQRLFARRFL
jgi:hypothetical protein